MPQLKYEEGHLVAFENAQDQRAQTLNIDIGNQLRAFGLSSSELDLLRGLRPTLERSLEHILIKSRDHFSAWPEIVAALSQPDIHRARYAHWMRAATGDFGPEFLRSATEFSATFCERKIPAYAITLCHYAVLDVALDALKGEGKSAKRGLFNAGKSGGGDNEALFGALRKAAWLDVEVLLETYNLAERNDRRRVLDGLADQFNARVQSVVTGVAEAATELEATAKLMSSTAAQTSEQSTTVAAAAEQATANVSMVAASTDEMGKSVAEIAHQASHSSNVAAQAVTSARATYETIEQLSRSAEKIGEVVNLISDIAAQTNLLDRKSTRLNSSHTDISRMPSSA